MLSKLCSTARLLALLVAIAAAFTVIPYVSVVLLVLGGVAGLGIPKADQGRMFLIALVLTLGAKSLEAIPEVGTYLSAIFGGIGLATLGGSIVAITVHTLMHIKGDWTKPASA